MGWDGARQKEDSERWTSDDMRYPFFTARGL